MEHIIIIFLCIIIVGLILFNFFSYRRYRKKLNETLLDEIENIEEPLESTDDAEVPINIMIDSSRELMDLINDLVRIELIIYARGDFLIPNNSQKKLNVNYDDAITEISTKVFESLKSTIYVNANHIFNSEYLIRYIQNITIIQYFQHLNEMTSVSNYTEPNIEEV